MGGMFLRLLVRILRPIIEPARLHRQSQFTTLPPARADVIFVGDSITQGGIWNEWFPSLVTINRGIDGNTTAHVMERLDSIAASARHVFVLIGTNDLTMGVREDEIVANVRTIVTHIQTTVDGAHVTLQSVMPRRSRFTARLRSLNARYVALAAELGVDYLDLWPVLADAHDELDHSLTLDGLHLNGPGYERWVEVLRPIIEGPTGTPASGR